MSFVSWPNRDSEHAMVSAENMAEIEDEVFASGMPVPALMEKVGEAMTNWLLKNSCFLSDGVVVLVGPGHNGGDGLVVARELYLSGVKVSIWCPLPISKKLTSQHLAHANWLGIEEYESPPEPSDKSLWVDALFGIGQSRPLPELISKLLKSREILNPGRLVSLDVPSGLCSDSGRSLPGGAAKASFTLTVGCIKKGLVQDSALANVGSLVRIDLGFDKKTFKHFFKTLPLRILSTDLASISLPQPDPAAMKYQRGRVLVIAGSDDYRGAALLALKGAIASGVGSIQAALPNVLSDGLWQVAPEVVFAGEIQSSKNKEISISSFLADKELACIDSLLIGPGLGLTGDPWAVFAGFLEEFLGLLIIDADGLNRLASSEEGWRWFEKRKGPTWITPHQAEFGRLFPHLKHLEPLDAALAASKTSGVCVLLKGAHSVVADQNGEVWQLGETAPWVARAGLGDVLAGYVTGLGALGFANSNGTHAQLLAKAAFIHSEAARRCKDGSSAAAIAASLGRLTTALQSGDFG